MAADDASQRGARGGACGAWAEVPLRGGVAPGADDRAVRPAGAGGERCPGFTEGLRQGLSPQGVRAGAGPGGCGWGVACAGQGRRCRRRMRASWSRCLGVSEGAASRILAMWASRSAVPPPAEGGTASGGGAAGGRAHRGCCMPSPRFHWCLISQLTHGLICAVQGLPDIPIIRAIRNGVPALRNGADDDPERNTGAEYDPSAEERGACLRNGYGITIHA
jgi:hypothetical protein